MSGTDLSGLSGAVLAGGASRRMGRDKRALRLNGRTLLEIQVDKLRALGVGEILLSGAGCPPLPGTRVIPDEYPGRGPLGGLHACLRAARHPVCLVVSVDTPLVPAEVLAALCRAHRGGVTVLRRGAAEEPLIGVYDRAAAGAAAELLDSGIGAVRALSGVLPWRRWDYSGPEELLLNCNTPEDLREAERLAGLRDRAGPGCLSGSENSFQDPPDGVS